LLSGYFLTEFKIKSAQQVGIMNLKTYNITQDVQPMTDFDTIFAVETEPEQESVVEVCPWKIMIVDDDLDIHEVTRLALTDFTFQERPLEFVSAYSGFQARELIEENTDTALILLDVVMEEDDSGLRFVEYVRNELKNKMVRIVLRTGQPGMAPERNVTQEYDINDYKTKSELTSSKLFNMTVSSLRSFQALQEVEMGREALAHLNAELEKKTNDLANNALLLETIIERSVNQAVIVSDKDGVVRHYNSAAESMFGYDADEIIGKEILKLLEKENITCDHFQKVVDIIERNGEFFLFQERETFKGIIQVEMRVSYVLDTDKKRLGMVLIAEDVSLFRENIARLNQIEKLLSEQKPEAPDDPATVRLLRSLDGATP
jgi:PAS domain S-box-containing protein